jgi:hypothetical protein
LDTIIDNIAGTGNLSNIPTWFVVLAKLPDYAEVNPVSGSQISREMVNGRALTSITQLAVMVRKQVGRPQFIGFASVSSPTSNSM